MPESHLEHMFGTVVQQEGQPGFVALRQVGLTDAQRDTADSQVERFEQAVRRSVIGEFPGDQHGDAAQLLHKRVRRLLMVRALCKRVERLHQMRRARGDAGELHG